LQEVYKKREYDHKLKKEIDMIKREERLENVERMNRAKMYRAEIIKK